MKPYWYLFTLLLLPALATPSSAKEEKPCPPALSAQTLDQFLAKVRRETRDLRIDPDGPLNARLAPDEDLYGKRFFGVFRRFYRGFSILDYDTRSLIRYLAGDREYEIRSWRYSVLLAQFLKEGIPLAEAIDRTDRDLTREIIDEILRTDPISYATRQARSAWFTQGPELRSSSALSFAPRIDDIALHFAMKNLGSNMRARRRPQIAIILVLKERRPRGIPVGLWGLELQVPSHVPASDVEGAYVAYPSPKGDVAYGVPARWYYVEVRRLGRKIEFAVPSPCR